MGGGGVKEDRRLLRKGARTTGEGMFGQNKSTEESVIGIRGEGDNRRVDFFFFYHKNKRLLLSCKKPSL